MFPSLLCIVRRPLVSLLIVTMVAMARGSAQADSLKDIPAIVAAARGAVVSISSRPLTMEDFGERASTIGVGSGFFIDPNGLIVTSFHVIDGAVGPIRVTLADDRSFVATLVGVDQDSDLALLRVRASNVPYLKLGDSGRLVIGEAVIAIGNAMWIEGGPSVTAGIVSALNRSLEQPGLPLLHHLIQTDAAINPGNSGGPLLNHRGEAVAVNTALIPTARGIGFAIPSNDVKSVVRELLATGRVVRRWLGLDIMSLTRSMAYANDLPVERGGYVVRVAPDVPATGGVVMVGDVVLAIDGQAVKNLHDFEMALSRQRIGATVTVTVQRGASRLEIRRPVLERRSHSELPAR